MFRLDGKHAVVTGAGSGIGAAIAKLFARQGASVTALDLDLAAAKATLEQAVRCDVTDAADVKAVFDTIGRIDILVNSAGIAHVGTVLTTSEADFVRVFEVNVKGVFLCARAAVPRMLAQGGGVILNMASVVSHVGIPDRFAYSMSKGAVHTMTMSIATDYVKKNIRCNCISPARI